MAQPLLRQKNTLGTLKHAREVHAAVEIDELVGAVAEVDTTWPRLAFLHLGRPGKADACVICVPTGELIEPQPTRRQV
jgi:hypothetical protein